jgi:hypothetical protein
MLKLMLLDRRGEQLTPLAQRQLDTFQPAFEGLAKRAATARP